MTRWSWVLVVVVLSACTAGLRAPPAPEVAGPVSATATPDPGQDPSGPDEPRGHVTVAQPTPISTWWQRSQEDVGAGDLAPLWSLPLYRTDPLGRQVPALATAARIVETGAPWTVEVALAAGSWSDGSPVTATDVVATAEALAAARPAAWGAWTGATAVDPRTAQLSFDRPFAGWARLLSTAPGVLPAHVLADGGLEAYARELPVTGGWFALQEHRPGISMRFEAHPGSPLQAPALAGIEVLVVPDTDTTLGLLADGTADLALGHVVMSPDERWQEVPGLVGASPFGGTRFELVWSAGEPGQRAAAASGLDPVPFVDGVLREVGRRPGGLLPSHERMAQPTTQLEAQGTAAIRLARTVEGLGLIARRLQADLADAGMEASLVRLDPPQHLDPPVDTDAHLRLVRVDPMRSLAELLASVGLDPEVGLAADAAGVRPLDPLAVDVAPPDALLPVIDLLVQDPRVLPIAEVAVTHTWDPDRIAGVAPSAWPGIGFWNAGEWTTSAA